MIRSFLSAFLLCSLVAIASQPAHAQPAPVAGGSPAPANAVVTPPGAPSQPYATFVAGAERHDGPISVLSKNGELYFDLTPDSLQRTYLIAVSIGASFGANALLTPGSQLLNDNTVISFKRVGHRIFVMEPNANYLPSADPSIAQTEATSLGDAVMLSLPILAEDPASQHVVVSASFLMNDPGVAKMLAPLGAFHPDLSRSYVRKIAAFPKNVDINIAFTFAGAGASPALQLSADPQSLPVDVHYNIVDLPATDAYVPRLADDRVGYFVTERRVFGAIDPGASPYARYLLRWDLSKGPVVFYLTNSIPAKYRPTIRAALLRWNDAFARVGYPHAVVVRDQPADPSWDPEDFRYNVVRWVYDDHPLFSAEGQPVANPFTGEILRAEIVIDGEAIRQSTLGRVELARSEGRGDMTQIELPIGATGDVGATGEDASAAPFERDALASSAFAWTALRTGGQPLGYEQIDAYTKQELSWVVLHESGHALGLRHNFAGSAAYSLAQIDDAHFRATHGVSASVMDYLPVYLTPQAGHRAAYFQDILGTYDFWAIDYGYSQFGHVNRPDDERAALARIADRARQPELRYAPDEDAIGLNAVDPFESPMDLSSDPLAYDERQFTLVRSAAANLDKRYPRDGSSFGDERLAFDTLLGQYLESANLATRYIGGVEISRAHRGEGGPPYRPVPIAQERRAFDAIAQNVYASSALQFSPQLLNDLGRNYWDSDASSINTFTLSHDYSIVDRVGDIQDAVLYNTFSLGVTNRLIEAEKRETAPGQTMTIDDLFAWTTDAIWDSLWKPTHHVELQHRLLQRKYTDLLISMALLDGPTKRVLQLPTGQRLFMVVPSSVTQELARAQLVRIERGLTQALASQSWDASSKAHLDDERARIAAELEAKHIRV